MGKFDGILFATDLDGTLLKRDKTISKENEEAIEYFKREGGLFTFITGRLPYYVRDMYERVAPNAPVGAGNGGAVYDFEKEEYLWTHPISRSVFDLVEEVERAFPEMGIQVHTFERSIFSKDSEVMRWFRKITGLPFISIPYREVDEPISKILFADFDEGLMERLRNFLEEHPLAQNFDLIRSEKRLFEVLPKGIDKATTLLKIAELCGIKREKCIAIGDYNNDIAMVKSAGLGIAVSNAHEDLKRVADHITVSNEESAIAKVIEDLESGNLKI